MVACFSSFNVNAQTSTQVATANTIKETTNTQTGTKGNWTNHSPENLKSKDISKVAKNSIGISYNLFNAERTNYLDFSNFQFNLPQNAVIDGVELSITRRLTGIGPISMKDHEVKLILNGSVSTKNKSDNSKYQQDVFSTKIYGGSNDLWGENLNCTNVNNSNFGVRISAISDNAAGISDKIPEIDQVQLTIYYSLSAMTIHLLSFEAEILSNQDRLLSWEIASEFNMNCYVLERLKDDNFVEISTTKAKNNTFKAESYSVIDNEFVTDSILYYRLGERNMDGELTYYPIISVVPPKGNLIDVFPNPTTDHFSIKYRNFNPEIQNEFILLDDKGVIVYSIELSETKEFIIENLKKGIYIGLFKKGNGNYRTIKMVKM
ncbi:MAG: T9SS type A sorting domain-containing protein [Bacteroidetes bacterium]|nr:T9SS type A sorting domain-containing protein [Bacteroidota bacterium]